MTFIRAALQSDAPTINWKGGTPGNPYVAGDTAVAGFDEIVMVQVLDPDVVTIQLPAITTASAGKRVAVRNLTDKKTTTAGKIAWSPDAADAMEAVAVDQDVAGAGSLFNSHHEWESDGVGRWNHVGWGAPLFQAPYP
jgi:hypothetical protein